jgi:hypothetical protein
MRSKTITDMHRPRELISSLLSATRIGWLTKGSANLRNGLLPGPNFSLIQPDLRANLNNYLPKLFRSDRASAFLLLPAIVRQGRF